MSDDIDITTDDCYECVDIPKCTYNSEMDDFVKRLRNATLHKEDITLFGVDYVLESKLNIVQTMLASSNKRCKTLWDECNRLMDEVDRLSDELHFKKKEDDAYDDGEDMIIIGSVKPFSTSTSFKDQIIKIAEEVMEVYGAWDCEEDSEFILYECADVIMAVVNLLYKMNVKDFRPYIKYCEKKNEQRGRYGKEQ